jgi:hypothetical protein
MTAIESSYKCQQFENHQSKIHDSIVTLHRLLIIQTVYIDPWNPSKNQQISQVEQIHRKAARYILNDYHDRSPGAVTNMIDTLQWDSLACRRTKASMILLCKINGGLVEVPTTMLSQSDRCTCQTNFITFLSSLIQY